MKLEIFDNTTGFRPKGSVLKWWVLLPQISGTIGDKQIPSLFGNLKSFTIPVLMVLLTIGLDGALIYQLDEEGVSIIALLALSAADFAIAILPLFFLYGLNLYPNLIRANLFIRQVKLEIDDEIPPNFKGNKEKYREDLITQRKTFNNKKSIVTLIEAVFVLLIIASGVYKFIVYFDVFGEDIFIIGVGRFIMTVIIISIITHIFFTKTVFTYLLFKLSLNRQLNAFRKSGLYSLQNGEIDKKQLLKFDVPFTSEFSNNQFIGQLADTRTDNNAQNSRAISHGTFSQVFRIDKFIGNKDIYVVYNGLLTDPEINALYSSQENNAAKEAVIAQCKEVQISQF